VKHAVSDYTESCLTSVVVTKAWFIIYISPFFLKRKIDDNEENTDVIIVFLKYMY